MNKSEHMDHLKVVLQVLKKYKLFAKYSIFEFLLRSVAFIVLILYSEGAEVDPRKMEAVKICPTRLAPTNIRSFLGLVENSRRFMDGFASFASPLTTFTQKNVKVEWSKVFE